MDNAKKLWNDIIDILSKEINSIVIIDVWFKTLDPLYIRDNTLYLSSLTQSNIDMINGYMPRIMTALAGLSSTVTMIKVVLGENKEEEVIVKDNDTYSEDIKPTSTHIDTEALYQRQSFISNQTHFNNKYTFDNFVVGNSNQYVYAACRSVADYPGQRYNPLFIYGGVGLGKTHLMQAIGNHILSNNPNYKIMYVTSERFMNDFIQSIHGGTSTKDDGINSDFRNKYRGVDVLMVDDIQFITKNAERTQEEFFHTFNDLYNQNKQIIITSDRPPKELSTLVERLRSRFEWGMIADIKPPDVETRTAILKKKAELQKCNISYEVLSLIAEKSTSNIRELEGLLTRVIFYASLTNSVVTRDIVSEALKDIVDSKKEAVNIDNIIDIVCDYFSISRDDILGKKKTKDIVEPRQICIYLINELLSLPLSAIADKFSRDHTTIMHARDKIVEKVETDSKFKTYVKDLKDMICKN